MLSFTRYVIIDFKRNIFYHCDVYNTDTNARTLILEYLWYSKLGNFVTLMVL